MPAGWTAAESKADGVSVGIPQGWISGPDKMFDMSGMMSDQGMDPNSAPQIDPNSAIGQMASDLEKDSKAMAEKDMLKLREKGILLYIRDTSRLIPGEERTHYSLKKVESGALNLKGAVAEEKKHLTDEGEGTEVKLPIGPAVRFETNNTSRGGDKIHEIVYVLQDGKTSYVLRFVATNNPSVLGSIADEVAKTLRITPGKD